MPGDQAAAAALDLATAAKRHGDARRAVLLALATRLDGQASAAKDMAKVRMLADVVRKLAGSTAGGPA
jgi:hypothetical protein